MRDYGKVYTAFWISEDARSLSEDGRMLALYLMTCQHGNMLGTFRLTNAYAADDLQWESERVSKGFVELLSRGFVYRCDRTFWVFIRQFLKWNQFENPNVAIAAGKMFDCLSCPDMVKALLAKALREYAPRFPTEKLDQFEALSEPFDNPFALSSKTRATTVATTATVAVTKAETGENNIVEQKPIDLVAEPVPVADPIPEIFAYWQKVMKSPRSVLDDKRRAIIKKALKNYSPADICIAIRGCSKSPYHMGDNESKTVYNFLHLILRSAEYIEKFIRYDSSPPKARGGGESVDEHNARVIAEMCGDDDDDDGRTIEMEREEHGLER